MTGIIPWEEPINYDNHERYGEICKYCKLDEEIEGCRIPINDREVVKGVGVIECKGFK